MDQPSNLSVPRPGARLDPHLWRTLAIAALGTACFVIAEPFLSTVAWAVTLAVSAWPAFAWLDRVLGGKRRLAGVLLDLLGPIRRRREEFARDPGEVLASVGRGAEIAREAAAGDGSMVAAALARGRARLASARQG